MAQRCQHCGHTFSRAPIRTTVINQPGAGGPQRVIAAIPNAADPAHAPVSNKVIVGSTLFVFLLCSLVGATYVAYDRKMGPFAPHVQAAAAEKPGHADTGGVVEDNLISELFVGMPSKDVRKLLGPPRHDENDETMMVLRELADEGITYWSYETPAKAPLLIKFRNEKIIEIKTPQDFAEMSKGM